MAGTAYHDILKDPSLFREVPLVQFQELVNQYPHIPLYRAMLAAKGMQDGHPDSGKWLETAAIYVYDRRQLKRLMQRWTTIESPQATVHGPQMVEEGIPSRGDGLEHAVDDEQEIHEKGQLSDEEVAIESGEVAEEGHASGEPEFMQESTETKPEEEDGQSAVEEEEEEVQDEELELQKADSQLTSEDDEIFLKAIGKWEPEKELKGILEDEWIMEAPGRKQHVLKLNDVLDQGLVQTDIRWMAPWLEEFDFPYAKEIIRDKPIAVEGLIAMPQAASKNAEPDTGEALRKSEAPIVEEGIENNVELEKNVEGKPVSTTWSSTHSFEEWLTILAQKQKASDNDAPIFELPQAELVQATSETSNPEAEFPPISSSAEQTDIREEDVRKMAEESISTRDELATETLARIYVKQGKVQHAIKVYQILTKKYPEKSSYFAAQIQQLKAE